MIWDELGQMYTLEGATTAIMMLFLISFVVQASPLTPLTSSSSNQQVEAHIETKGNDLLIVLDNVADDETYSDLKMGLMLWSGMEHDGQTQIGRQQVREIYDKMNSVMLADGTAYNLEVGYLNEDEVWDSKKVFWNGLPSDNAVLVTRKVVIHDEDRTYARDYADANNLSYSWVATTLPDLSDNTEFMNILDVKLTLWRM